jgi:hypothetical protein
LHSQHAIVFISTRPDIKYFCDLDYDPFLVMEDGKKVYGNASLDPYILDLTPCVGFTLSLYEYEATIPTLWNHVKSAFYILLPGSAADGQPGIDFVNSNKELLPADNAMAFLSDDGGESYNRCHFWSNFEIGDLDLWRSEAYMKFFNYLDEQGGFYYERWGDAPVHSIGAALFANRSQLHFFSDIGYRHEPFQVSGAVDFVCGITRGLIAHRSTARKALSTGRASVGATRAITSVRLPECARAGRLTRDADREWYSCLNRYDKLFE